MRNYATKGVFAFDLANTRDDTLEVIDFSQKQ